MRLILALCMVLFAGMGSVLISQESAREEPPVITLYLPPAADSESVQINYFMLGPFGGYGGYVKAEKGRVSYDIPASVDRKPADTVKIIAYVPGCEIAKLEITMRGASDARTLPCETLGQVPLHGRILSIPAAEASAVEVEINYLADWDHEFFGISDGPVTSIHIATVIPDESGRFEVALPDFFRQKDLGDGSFQLILRDKSTLNIIAMLKPENAPRSFEGLALASSYAPFVLFSADTSISTPQSADSDNRKN